ncbi:U-box domain-containing protein 16 [Cicer arietinum]|uniref:RING-type E3 ubiquitin transferase n=1 Tax=Cicer arietinum TaxID=3827 RepID=A0A1S2YL54_CICAR|nr:U-box domain-containing protein 16 [Cicer arietinum]
MKSHHQLLLHSSFTSNNNYILPLNANSQSIKTMAISPQIFPTRKRPPSESSFISPTLTHFNLLHSLLHLTHQICSFNAAPWCRFLLNRISSSTIRKTQLLGVVFEDLIRNSDSTSTSISAPLCSHSFVLCLEEMYIVLHRIQTLVEDCSNGSKFSILMQIETVADNFHKLTGELSTLLDVFPLQELNLSDDVLELIFLIRKQCSESKTLLGEEQIKLRNNVVFVLEGIKREIVPNPTNLASIFEKLEIRDSSSCRGEIESLQEEIQNRNEEQPKYEIVALIGLVRYAKCVLFGASTPSTGTESLRRNQSLDMVVPSDYRCPISLELMRDPVVVATGQTYDRGSIKLWMDSGHNTCPKTGQTLAHTDLIPNHALRNMIAMWCREQRIPFEGETVAVKINGGVTNKTALEATRMTASFLINKLTNPSLVLDSKSIEDTNAVVYELRVLAKTDSESRACIAEAGAIPLLVPFLSYENGLQHPRLQINAVTTILNLSILESNKTRIMETDGALNGVADVLRSGATWEAKANAAATVFSLTGVPAFRKRLGRKTRVVSGLVELAKGGPEGAKRDALAAILNLAADRETVARLVESGAVEMTAGIMAVMPEEAVTILEAVVKRGGLVAVAAAFVGIKKLGTVLREGSERARESAAATLVTMCRKGGSEIVGELAAISGVERVIWELMAVGSVRGRRKAATLLRILRRWAAGLDGGETEGFSTTTAVSTSTTVVVPTPTSLPQ